MSPKFYQRFPSKRRETAQILRTIMLVMLIEDWIYVGFSLGWLYVLNFLTAWAELGTIIFILLTFIIDAQESPSACGWLAGVHHLVFEFVITLSIVVPGVYWPFLHEFARQSSEYVGQTNRTFHLYFSHAVPAIFAFVNFILTDVVVKKRHGLGLVVVGIAYGIVNYRAATWAG